MFATGTASFRSALCLVLLLATPVAAQQCREDRVDIRQDGLRVSIEVEIADTDEERARGLMFVEDMAQLEGMLFVYQDEPRQRSFWMRNTLIPLDMLFVAADGTVRDIHVNATPLDETPIPSATNDIFAVLEVNGGLTEMLGLTPGAQLRHPAFDTNPIWPCD
ncbi:DUF192 domain-containing protein [Pontibrevibacter nitratireducens]|uniref:DUF192 domain-containing protein n=1 Tax=Pontivivens nitratireducens TaxID=2758038 RepID=A0A6G7VLI2_9RHOB|nr:DUF192 domain-containing protein [Pontibrevibacter nitratireducens]